MTASRWARELVAQLIAHESQNRKSAVSDVGVVVSAIDRVLRELNNWVGAEGCRALLLRALSRAQANHPALSSLEIRRDAGAALEGVPEGSEIHGGPVIAAGLESMLVTLFELLSRLIGEDLSSKLVEQSMAGDAVPWEGAEDRETQE